MDQFIIPEGLPTDLHEVYSDFAQILIGITPLLKELNKTSGRSMAIQLGSALKFMKDSKSIMADLSKLGVYIEKYQALAPTKKPTG